VLLTLVAVARACAYDERLLHAALEDLRRHGEWFDLGAAGLVRVNEALSVIHSERVEVALARWNDGLADETFDCAECGDVLSSNDGEWCECGEWRCFACDEPSEEAA
jgi:hypothetical protein